MVDGLLQHDEYSDVCPICKEIVTEEVWPAPISRLEEKTGQKFPPCIVCGSEEDIHYNYLTMPQKDGRGFNHNLLIWCESCGSGTMHDGFDALTGKPKIALRLPPEFSKDSMQKIQQRLKEALDNGDEDEDLANEVRLILTMRAFFRVHHYPCLDDGWDAMGHGVRPLERTDIMKRFYELTNDEAIGIADASENPLTQRRNSRTQKKKKRWW